jgi:hypothetical protein
MTSHIWWANTLVGNGMMMEPYAHPHHMTVVNHLKGIWKPFHVGQEHHPLQNGIL